MAQFIRVRLVKANSLDLSLFQFDHDLTFAAFFFNADRTLYGRFGTRSQQQADNDISLKGFAAALQGALELHEGYPGNKASFQGKQPRPVRHKIPEDYPLLRGKYKPTLDYEGQVARSCIHCHQVGEAVRMEFREAKKPMPDPILYPWPMPEVVGLVLDPNHAAKVASVETGSLAAQAGFQPGDRIINLNGQPLVSVADVQWVLHHAGEKDSLAARISRGGRNQELIVKLEKGWRRRGDISWRTTSWDLRRMVTGGLLLKELNAEERQAAGIGEESMALRCQHVGQYGEHATAKNAGFLKGDIVVGWDGKQGAMSETEIITWMLRERMPGRQIPVKVKRGDRQLEFELRMK